MRVQPRALVRNLLDHVDRHDLIEAFAAVSVEKFGRGVAHGIAQAIERRIDRA
jgi:hypothetical protein